MNTWCTRFMHMYVKVGISTLDTSPWKMQHKICVMYSCRLDRTPRPWSSGSMNNHVELTLHGSPGILYNVQYSELTLSYKPASGLFMFLHILNIEYGVLFPYIHRNFYELVHSKLPSTIYMSTLTRIAPRVTAYSLTPEYGHWGSYILKHVQYLYVE